MGGGPGGDAPLDQIAFVRAAFVKALEQEGIELDVIASAEHYLSPELIERIAGSRILPVDQHTKWLLLEAPWDINVSRFEKAIFWIQTQGFRILLAHPERTLFLTPKQIRIFSKRGIKMQLNLGSFEGLYGPEVQDRALSIMRQGDAHVLSTDLHSPSNAPGWVVAAIATVREKFGEDTIDRTLVHNPKKILEDASPASVV